METIFKNPKLKSQNGRNAFDRSQHRVWHSPFGALLPCFCKRVNPHDYVELSVESQTICDKLIRPAFIRLKSILIGILYLIICFGCRLIISLLVRIIIFLLLLRIFRKVLLLILYLLLIKVFGCSI